MCTLGSCKGRVVRTERRCASAEVGPPASHSRCQRCISFSLKCCRAWHPFCSESRSSVSASGSPSVLTVHSTFTIKCRQAGFEFLAHSTASTFALHREWSPMTSTQSRSALFPVGVLRRRRSDHDRSHRSANAVRSSSQNTTSVLHSMRTCSAVSRFPQMRHPRRRGGRIPSPPNVPSRAALSCEGGRKSPLYRWAQGVFLFS